MDYLEQINAVYFSEDLDDVSKIELLYLIASRQGETINRQNGVIQKNVESIQNLRGLAERTK